MKIRLYIGKKYGTLNLKKGSDLQAAKKVISRIKGICSGDNKLQALKDAGFINNQQ